MNTRLPKLIIFDMDGVIIDSEPLHENARQMMYKKFDIKPDDSLPNPIGNPTDGYWKLCIDKYKLDENNLELEKMQYDLVLNQIIEYNLPPSNGLMEVLKWAKENNIKIALASSSTRHLVDGILKGLKVHDFFDCVIAGDEVKVKKPDPEIYLRILKKLGIKPGDAVAIEDSNPGIMAAMSAGIFCYGYNNPTSLGQDVSIADKKIDSLIEIISA